MTHLNEIIDAACCSLSLHEHSRRPEPVPLIDHNPRAGREDVFKPEDALRYDERSVAERSNARLEDELNGKKTVRVQGGIKVVNHVMFGILA